MADLEATNWFGDLVSHPKVIVQANSVDDLVAVTKDPDKYPAPVRAVGSNHSTAPCGMAESGTLVQMIFASADAADTSILNLTGFGSNPIFNNTINVPGIL